MNFNRGSWKVVMIGARILAAIAGVSVAQGCAIEARTSPEQRRQMQTRTFSNADYETVFRAYRAG